MSGARTASRRRRVQSLGRRRGGSPLQGRGARHNGHRTTVVDIINRHSHSCIFTGWQPQRRDGLFRLVPGGRALSSQMRSARSRLASPRSSQDAIASPGAPPKPRDGEPMRHPDADSEGSEDNAPVDKRVVVDAVEWLHTRPVEALCQRFVVIHRPSSASTFVVTSSRRSPAPSSATSWNLLPRMRAHPPHRRRPSHHSSPLSSPTATSLFCAAPSLMVDLALAAPMPDASAQPSDDFDSLAVPPAFRFLSDGDLRRLAPASRETQFLAADAVIARAVFACRPQSETDCFDP